ncbi:flagellar biosynthesis anti-sigma factor FlgM [Paraburkholderia youngii]|uniref:flagellar biosynthesis anti-sigma factor FlgM n=1 Tax=Paraburkholderia youngii TaxID=2782701 RepID=UPI003D25AEB4
MISSTSQINSRKRPVVAAKKNAAPSPAVSVQDAATTAPVGAGASGDTIVTLSGGLTTELQALSASGAADIDHAMVETVKAALADGSLVIDAGRIADGIIATARELLAAGDARAGAAA